MNNCPFLGQDDDPQTHIGFSSERNYCYRTEKPTAVLNEQQQVYCLTKDYPGCPVYQDISHLTLPIEIPHESSGEPKRSTPKIAVALFVSFLIIVLMVTGWFYKSVSSTQVQPTETIFFSNATSIAVNQTKPSPISIATATPTMYPSLTPTDMPTPIPSTAIPLGLGTPSKTTPQLVIHRITQGDSLALLASRYGTSVAAIRSVNYYHPVPLWDGVLVVIPVNTLDVSNLPAFEPYQVKERSLTLKDVAYDLNTTPELLSQYNSTDPNAILFVDSWLFVPRPFPPPTGLPLATQDGKIQNDGG